MKTDLHSRKPPQVISIVNQKGGVGKTTTAINFSAALAMSGAQTLLIDFDPQGNASTGLGIDHDRRRSSAYEAMSGLRTLSECICSTPVQKLSIVPSRVDLSGTELELLETEDRAERLRQLINTDELLSEYDFIVLDCPPALNLLTVNALVASDRILVPLQCEFFALEGLSQLIKTTQSIQRNFNSELILSGIILTMYDRRNNLSAQVEQDVRSILGDSVYKTVIPRNIRLSEAPSHSLPALIYDPGCSGSKAYMMLADEFLERLETELAA